MPPFSAPKRFCRNRSRSAQPSMTAGLIMLGSADMFKHPSMNQIIEGEDNSEFHINPELAKTSDGSAGLVTTPKKVLP